MKKVWKRMKKLFDTNNIFCNVLRLYEVFNFQIKFSINSNNIFLQIRRTLIKLSSLKCLGKNVRD